MIRVHQISKKRLKEFVEVAYKGDGELLDKYHVKKYTFEEAVNETVRMIEITAKGLFMKYYAVCLDEIRIGYLALFSNNLYSFGINIKYRTPEILSDVWSNIKRILGNSFICMLYPNNTRAINWLKRCGMIEVPEVEESCITLLNIN